MECGVFKEIGPEKMAVWDGPVNYISLMEAFKEGPHSTTPLRICMNSSLKQPKPVSLSLNDCLVKGLSALVTFCIREHIIVHVIPVLFIQMLCPSHTSSSECSLHPCLSCSYIHAIPGHLFLMHISSSHLVPKLMSFHNKYYQELLVVG